MSHAANFFAFLVLNVACFSFVYPLLDFVELFVTLVHVYIGPMKSELWSVCWF